jgi:hypothetical protein
MDYLTPSLIDRFGSMSIEGDQLLEELLAITSQGWTVVFESPGRCEWPPLILIEAHRSIVISITVYLTGMPLSGPSICPQSRGVSCPLHHSGKSSLGFCHGLDAINDISFPMLSGSFVMLHTNVKTVAYPTFTLRDTAPRWRIYQTYEV